jgi:hypothetical protein
MVAVVIEPAPWRESATTGIEGRAPPVMASYRVASGAIPSSSLPVDGIGKLTSSPSSAHVLGMPPYLLSKPLRLKMSLFTR